MIAGPDSGEREITVRNLQRKYLVDSAKIRGFAGLILCEGLKLNQWELGIHLVGPGRMAEVNWEFLRHEGATDVITFDHGGDPSAGVIHGELFVCPAIAAEFAASFHTSWQQEVLRYIVHGILHLMGHDDLQPAPRRRMKAVEHRLVRKFAPLDQASGLVG